MIEFRKLTINDEILFMEYFNAWGEEQESIVPSATNLNRYDSFQTLFII
ncbi:hypothetical protein [Macrococcus capreoli]